MPSLGMSGVMGMGAHFFNCWQGKGARRSILLTLDQTVQNCPCRKQPGSGHMGKLRQKSVQGSNA